MASGGGTLRFTVEVAADQATGALNALSQAFNQAGIEANTKLLGIGKGSRQAAEEVTSLAGRMKEFASEQRQQARVANFYVRELAELAPVSDTVKTALGGVVGALAGGFGLGMALDLTLTSIKLVIEYFGRAAKEAEKFAAESAKAIDELDKRIEGLQNKTGGEKALQEWRLTQLQVQELKEKKAALEAVTAAARADTSLSTFQLGEITKGNDELARKYGDQIQQLERRSSRLQEIARLELVNADAAESARRKLKADEDAAKAAADQVKQLAHELTAYREALEAQAKSRQWMPEVAGGPQGLDKALSAANENVAKQVAKDAKAARDEQEAYNREVQQSAELASRWGTAIGSAIGQLATGEATVGQVIARIGQQIIQTTVQAAIASITASASRAGAEAAASQAGIPIVGPVLAISAMGAIMSSVLGLLSNLPSARNGWWDTGSYEGLMWIHRNERVLNAREAQSSRDGGGGGGGPLLQVNIASSFGGRDVERTLTRYDGGVQRSIRKLQRQRRA